MLKGAAVAIPLTAHVLVKVLEASCGKCSCQVMYDCWTLLRNDILGNLLVASYVGEMSSQRASVKFGTGRNKLWDPGKCFLVPAKLFEVSVIGDQVTVNHGPPADGSQ